MIFGVIFSKIGLNFVKIFKNCLKLLHKYVEKDPEVIFLQVYDRCLYIYA